MSSLYKENVVLVNHNVQRHFFLQSINNMNKTKESEFLIKRSSFVTFEVILHFMKNLRLHNVSIHRNFNQNRFINECDRKRKAKIP